MQCNAFDELVIIVCRSMLVGVSGDRHASLAHDTRHPRGMPRTSIFLACLDPPAAAHDGGTAAIGSWTSSRGDC